MNKIVAFLIACVLAGALVFAYLNQSQSKSGASAGAWVGPASLESRAGNVLLLDFWATWCPPCKKAMPGVQRLHERFAGRPVQVIGANISENADPAAYMAEHGFTYELMLNAEDLAREYNVEGIPTFVILSPTGELVHQSVGYDPAHEEEIGKIIEAQLAQNGL